MVDGETLEEIQYWGNGKADFALFAIQVPGVGRSFTRPCDPLPVIADDGQLLAGQDAFDDQVQGALGTLEEVPRACLLLKVVMELGYREIGRLLDIPEGTAMSHVHRSRKRMKAQLWAVEGRADIRRMGS